LLENNTNPLYLVENKTIQGKEKHPEATANIWKQVPNWLENPTAVFDSATVNGRLVFIAPKLINGKPILMVVEPNGRRGNNKCTNVLINTYDFNSKKLPKWF